MNSKFLLILFFLISCGVKKAPTPPSNIPATPSFFDTFNYDEKVKDEDLEKKKNSENE